MFDSGPHQNKKKCSQTEVSGLKILSQHHVDRGGEMLLLAVLVGSPSSKWAYVGMSACTIVPMLTHTFYLLLSLSLGHSQKVNLSQEKVSDYLSNHPANTVGLSQDSCNWTLIREHSLTLRTFEMVVRFFPPSAGVVSLLTAIPQQGRQLSPGI